MSFSHIVLRLFTSPLLLLQSLQNPKTLLLLSLLLLPLPPLSYYFATKHFAADTKFSGVVELTTQLLILENILWLPLCRINKFGMNTLPSKTVAIPYSCGLSNPPVYIDTGGARVTQGWLQRRRYTYPYCLACLPRQGESHPDTGQSLQSCIFIVQQSGRRI